MHFNIAYSFFWFLASLLLASGAAYVLYRNNPLKFEHKGMRYGIGILRFLTLLLLCLLLMEPLIKWMSQKKEKPILVLAIDNSESMRMNKDSVLSLQIPSKIEALKEALADRFLVQTYTLGEQTKPNEELNFSEKLSNLSEPIDQIYNDKYQLNLAGIVLVSDGIYNQGSNPIYAWKKGEAPIFTVGYGDTTQRKDALIGKVNYNPSVFAGNDFEIDIDLKAFFCANEKMQYSVSEENNTFFKAQIPVIGNRYFGTQKIKISKAKEGIHIYQIRIAPLPGENNIRNNSVQIQVNVVRSKQKIVLIYNNPHPDITALRQNLESQTNYELQLSALSDYNYEGINEATMFILHQIPGVRGEGLKLVQQIQNKNIPCFFITGRQTGFPYLSNLGTLKIAGPSQNFNEAQAFVNPQFSLFQLDENLSNTLQKFAPLFTPYGNYQIPADAQVLLYQQLGYVKTTAPLLFFTRNNGANQAYLCGEGFWRWRLQDFAFNQNQLQTQVFISKIIQWVAGKNDKSKFRVNPTRKFYDENEAISFEAELFNDLYELVNESEISLNLKDKNGKSYPYQFTKTDKAYQLEIGNLNPGIYSYEASVNGKQNLGTRTGKISVKALETEALELRANHQLLRNLAIESGAQFYQANEWDKLQNALLANENMKTVVYETEENKELLNQKWIFFLLIGLLSLEWFIRKWNGFI
jgi:hypothetical protein